MKKDNTQILILNEEQTELLEELLFTFKIILKTNLDLSNSEDERRDIRNKIHIIEQELIPKLIFLRRQRNAPVPPAN